MADSGINLDPISGAISTASNLFKLFYGVGQTISGNKKLNQLEDNRPIKTVDPNILYNQQLAGQIASQGIPDASKNFYTDSIERGLGSTIQASLDSGQGLNTINQSFGNANDSFRQLLSMDAEQRLKNQQVLMDANKEVRDENLRAWDWNEAQKYGDKYKRYSDQTNAGAQNIFGGGQGVGSDLQIWNDYYKNMEDA
jgi:hypothetical protein